MLKRNQKLTLKLKLCPIMKLNICFTSIWSRTLYKYFDILNANYLQLAVQIMNETQKCHCVFKVSCWEKEEMNYLLYNCLPSDWAVTTN